jgi:hypothetical protein
MKNILMNKEMTKVILDGRKTQTRRVGITASGKYIIDDNLLKSYKLANQDILKCGKYQKGETIWVREPVHVENHLIHTMYCWYEADDKEFSLEIPDRFKDPMPRWILNSHNIPNGCIKEMARIFLKITDVRVERLHNCYSFEHLEAEGIMSKDKNGVSKLQEEMQDEWLELWDKTAPKGYKWNDNPYVFVYEFERVNKNRSEACKK